jgi:ATP-dependent helicase HrpB
MANGRLAQFYQPHPLEHDEYLVIPDLDGAQPISRMYLAAPILRDDLVKHFSERFQTQEMITWDSGTRSVLANKVMRLGELILKESRLHKPDPEVVLATLLVGIRNHGISCLPWSKAQRHWQSRVQFLRRVLGPEPAWPDVRDNVLLQTLESWLAPYLTDITSLSQVQRVDLTWPLQALLSAEQRRVFETMAPTHLAVPTGSRIALDYDSGEIPILAVRLQEVFGMTETPTVANGQIPVLIHLLSPARRPVQVTQDLTSFWKSGYAEVKKELKGRYPKHFWPEDPRQAPPTRDIKKRV